MHLQPAQTSWGTSLVCEKFARSEPNTNWDGQFAQLCFAGKLCMASHIVPCLQLRSSSVQNNYFALLPQEPCQKSADCGEGRACATMGPDGTPRFCYNYGPSNCSAQGQCFEFQGNSTVRIQYDRCCLYSGAPWASLLPCCTCKQSKMLQVPHMGFNNHVTLADKCRIEAEIMHACTAQNISNNGALKHSTTASLQCNQCLAV